MLERLFLTKAMCKLVEEQGLYLDVVSGGELFTAYKVGFPLNKVYSMEIIKVGGKLN